MSQFDDNLLVRLMEAGAAAEADRLLKAVSEAVDFGLAGRTADGYEWLVQRRHHEKQRVAEGAPWAEALMQGWQEALDRYAEGFRLGRA